MVRITEELIRKRAEHNEREIGTLEEISLHQEDIEKIEHLQHWCRDLKIILMQSNLISKIENLKKLKKLEYINLALNNIERVENLEGCESLQKLDLTLNFIGELTSVKHLQHNLFLEELFLTGNPCTDYKGYREYVITALPQLKKLDNSEILKSERIQALQIFDSIKVSILNEQNDYFRKREMQKVAAAKKYKSKPIGTENDSESFDPEKEKEFWDQPSENTPETRVEIANRVRKGKESNKTKDEVKPKRVIKRFSNDGRPLNINEAKIDFRLDDDDENNCYILELHVYKYLDTSLVDVDVQATYVSVLVKGKIFQITLDEEVKMEESTAQRSQTTGYLVIKMPKVQGKIKPKSKSSSSLSFLTNKESQRPHESNRRRELLEIGSGKRDMDYTKICENYRTESSTKICNVNKPIRKKDIEEKIPGKDFVDDLDVPPLE